MYCEKLARRILDLYMQKKLNIYIKFYCIFRLDRQGYRLFPLLQQVLLPKVGLKLLKWQKQAAAVAVPVLVPVRVPVPDQNQGIQ